MVPLPPFPSSQLTPGVPDRIARRHCGSGTGPHFLRNVLAFRLRHAYCTPTRNTLLLLPRDLPGALIGESQRSAAGTIHVKASPGTRNAAEACFGNVPAGRKWRGPGPSFC